ncbi:diaminopimelate decarboxylase [Marinilabiliaceae bacterium JC040]|nr:diaminopimelate decarboxylase [Marinilabiliaceae bacterium JC040]
MINSDILINNKTPFYYYDIDLLNRTLEYIQSEANKYNFNIHYAIKANSNTKILKHISSFGFGADCVSANEIEQSIQCGFNPNSIVYAGVGKADWEIELAINNNIQCFNCESIPEIEIINEIALKKNKKVDIAIRINPNIDAKTHKYITTGIEDSKFGINFNEIDAVLETIKKLKNLNLIGLHFHIGSQISDMNIFKDLCIRINEIHKIINDKGILLKSINVGGGLGVDYDNPENNIPDFKSYFSIFNQYLNKVKGQSIHFELGRSIVANCGTLISKVLYIKESANKKFAILDAGMNDLLRPALYNAKHKILNLSSKDKLEKYDIVGPVCESSDSFGKDIMINKASRNNYIAIKSTGAYGESMASRYNLRNLTNVVFSDVNHI